MAKRALPLFFLGLTVSGAPALAQLDASGAVELRELGSRFVAERGGDTLSRMQQLVTLGRSGTPDGTLSLGLFSGALSPLAETAPAPANAGYALSCHSSVTAPDTAPALSDERLELHRDATGSTAVRYSTSAATTHLQLDARMIGTSAPAQLARWQYSGPEGSMDVVPIGNGTLYRDDVSRAVLTPDQPHRQVIDDALAAVVAGNPNWFLTRSSVALGQPWPGAETLEQASPRIAALFAPLMGNNATLADIEIVSSVSGGHPLNKRDGVVIEYVGQMVLAAPGQAEPTRFALSGYEIYDRLTMARLQSDFSVAMDSGESRVTYAQRQDCVFN